MLITADHVQPAAPAGSAPRPRTSSTATAAWLHPGTAPHDYAARLERRGAPVVRDDTLPGRHCFSTQDPVGNHREFLQSLE
ncbi:hypothetical protein ACF065_16740 [Streptomyces sp. NPDC015232]|uniref:hypothetical protein n=1 Tax=unclassified Streptomyces TaxID=2593676 RepID=UPI00370026E4